MTNYSFAVNGSFFPKALWKASSFSFWASCMAWYRTPSDRPVIFPICSFFPWKTSHPLLHQQILLSCRLYSSFGSFALQCCTTVVPGVAAADPQAQGCCGACLAWSPWDMDGWWGARAPQEFAVRSSPHSRGPRRSTSQECGAPRLKAPAPGAWR